MKKKLKNVSAQKFKDELMRRINNYDSECDRGIPTCDLMDVVIWIEKVEKKLTK